jgi:DNA-binding NarL/FixJ family response regulator
LRKRRAGAETNPHLADDNHAVRRAMRHTLERNEDYKVCGEAENGREAIEKERELQPDLVVLDFSMPVMDGLEVARALKRSRPGIPIVLFTMFKDRFLEQEAFAAGVNVVVSKEEGISILSVCAGVLLKYAPGKPEPNAVAEIPVAIPKSS